MVDLLGKNSFIRPSWEADLTCNLHPVGVLEPPTLEKKSQRLIQKKYLLQKNEGEKSRSVFETIPPIIHIFNCFFETTQSFFENQGFPHLFCWVPVLITNSDLAVLPNGLERVQLTWQGEKKSRWSICYPLSDVFPVWEMELSFHLLCWFGWATELISYRAWLTIVKLTCVRCPRPVRRKSLVNDLS